MTGSYPGNYPASTVPLPKGDIGPGYQRDYQRLMLLQNMAELFEDACRCCEDADLESVREAGERGLYILDEFCKDYIAPAAKEAKGR